MRKKRHDLIIGIFVLVAIVITASLIIKFGGIQKYRETYTIAVSFSSVSGLIIDAPVYYAGIECGSVAELLLPDERLDKVRVVLKICKKTIIRAEDMITISSVSILGEKIVKIIPGNIKAERWPRWPEGPSLPGKDPIDPFVMVQDATGFLRSKEFQSDIQEIVRGFADLVNEKNRELFSKTINNLWLMSEGLVDDLKNLRAFLNEETFESLQNTINNLEKASEDIPALTMMITEFAGKNTENIEDLIVNLKQSSEDISAFLKSLKALLREISNAEGTLGKLIYSDELHLNLNQLIEDIDFYGLFKFQDITNERERRKREGKDPWEK